MLEIEALAGHRVEGLEQAFLQREGQGDRKAQLVAVQPAELAWRQDFTHQAFSAFVIQ